MSKNSQLFLLSLCQIPLRLAAHPPFFPKKIKKLGKNVRGNRIFLIFATLSHPPAGWRSACRDDERTATTTMSDVRLIFIFSKNLTITTMTQREKTPAPTPPRSLFLLMLLAALWLPRVAHADDYTLVWADEFENSSNLTANWNCEEVWNPSNGELQYYLPANVTIADGNLVITTKRESHTGNGYTKGFTSGRLNSQAKVKFQYGRLVAKIKMPLTANGLWPAFWMLGADFRGDDGGDIYKSLYHGSVDWPMCGEIDIMESGNAGGITNSTQDRYFSGAVHWGASLAAHQYDSKDREQSTAVQGDYHLFVCEWDENSIKFYFDHESTPYFTRATGASDTYFNKLYHILFNVAVGGTNGFTGCETEESITALPNSGDEKKMYVEYIRLYQKSGQTLELASGTANDASSVTADSESYYTGSDSQEEIPSVEIPAASTPTRAANQVRSIYSDAYTSVVPSMFVGSWRQTTQISNVSCSGNEAYQLTNFDYLGFEFNTTIDVSSMEYLHIDIYPTTDITYFGIVPIAYIESTGAGDDTHRVTASLTANQWNSLDIPLTDFGELDLTKIWQFKFDHTQGTATGETLYLDNIYFYTTATPDETAPVINTATNTTVGSSSVTLSLKATDNLGSGITWTIKSGSTTLDTHTSASGTATTKTITGLSMNTSYTLTIIAADNVGNTSQTTVSFTTASPAISAAPTPLHAKSYVKSVFSDAYESPELSEPSWAKTYNPSTWVDETLADGDAARHLTNHKFSAWSLTPAFGTSDLSGMNYLHFDVYSVSATQIAFHANGANGSGQYVTKSLTTGQWNSFDIPLSDFSGFNFSTTAFDSFKFTKNGDDDTGSTELYFDNIYFWKTDSRTLAKDSESDGIATLTGKWNSTTFGTIDGSAKATAYDLTDVTFSEAASTSGYTPSVSTETTQQKNCFFITNTGRVGFGNNELRKDDSGYTALQPIVIDQGADNKAVNTNVKPITVKNTASYSRTMAQSGVYLTGLAPFPVSTRSNAGFKAYALESTNTEGGVMILDFEETHDIAANTPYIFYTPDASYTLTSANGASEPFTITWAAGTSGGVFKSTYERIDGLSGASNIYTMPKLFTESETIRFSHYVGTYMPAFRAYLQLPSTTPSAPRISMSDLPTAIDGPAIDIAEPATQQPLRIYTLDGRRISTAALRTLQPGLYIVNGRKVVVR